MAAGQFPADRSAAAANPRRRAAPFLRPAAQAGRAAAARTAACVRYCLGLRGAHRQRAKPGTVHRIPERLPELQRIAPERTVGLADDAAGRAAGKPAPHGRRHCAQQTGARSRPCGLGQLARAGRGGPGQHRQPDAQARRAAQLPDPAVAAPADRAFRRSVRHGALDREKLPRWPCADAGKPERPGRVQPDGWQHHHHAARDWPD